MNSLSTLLSQFRIADALDILLVSWVAYQVLLLIRQVRAVRVVAGFGVLFLAAILAGEFHLLTLDWILSSLGPSFFLVVFVVVFQSDIRRAIAQLGRGRFWGGVFQGDAAVIQEVTQAVRELVKSKRGGLLVLERDESLQGIIDSGTKLEAETSSELLTTLFTPHSSLHDGAVVIRQGKIAAAGCILPLSQNPSLGRGYGTRHRAALGITEETDALAIVVSEENHSISFAMAGKVTPGIDPETLQEMLTLYGARSES